MKLDVTLVPKRADSTGNLMLLRMVDEDGRILCIDIEAIRVFWEGKTRSGRFDVEHGHEVVNAVTTLFGDGHALDG